MLSLDRVLGCVLWFWAYILVIALDHFLIFFFFLTVAVFPSRLHAELLILHFILRQSQNNITGDNGIAWFSLHISLFSCISILLVDTTFWKSCYQFKLMSENKNSILYCKQCSVFSSEDFFVPFILKVLHWILLICDRLRRGKWGWLESANIAAFNYLNPLAWKSQTSCCWSLSHPVCSNSVQRIH